MRVNLKKNQNKKMKVGKKNMIYWRGGGGDDFKTKYTPLSKFSRNPNENFVEKQQMSIKYYNYKKKF